MTVEDTALWRMTAMPHRANVDQGEAEHDGGKGASVMGHGVGEKISFRCRLARSRADYPRDLTRASGPDQLSR